ncbi:unnamed protein product [Plutella xylostella]|uniref:(diamondback moth) hypothetical protein n=1 Tax=Plutella xylostella TaxID=51655 RepID=A0A8S4EK52_PLUXY|nr:unnamed protein product [Plutella xylostella]
MMFGRPRCREWTPLATQQLRLRSLIQIVGYNIRPPEQCSSPCSFYLTLHHTTMSAPFFTSEKISSPHPKWKEIDSEITQCMSSSNVVIRIWCHILQPSEVKDKPQDTIIETWGTYFSGLRYIGPNLALNFTSDCFKSNTLVFQMHGGYFCSYKSLKLDIIPPENELEHGSFSSNSSNETNKSNKITIESKFIQSQRIQSRSVSPSKYSRKDEYSKSQSPSDRGFQQMLPKMRSLNNLSATQNTRDRRKEDRESRTSDSSQIYVHSPDNLHVKEFTMTDKHCDRSKNSSKEDLSGSKVDLSETAENYDLRNESDWVPKYRYLAINFLKSEIRPAYNVTKLQKLHLLQYSIKKRQEAVQDIKERIYKKSALSNLDQLNEKCDRVKFKSKSQRNLFSLEDDEEEALSDKSASQSDLSKNGRIKAEEKVPVNNGPRLTLKLNDLLSFKSKPSPFQRSEHIRLTKQLEILRFKRIILADERDRKLANIRRLKEIYNKILEENQDVGTELMRDYHALSRQTELLRESRQSASALKGLAARSHAELLAKRSQLLEQLETWIFPIEQKTPSSDWTICSIPLPVSGDDSRTALRPHECTSLCLVSQAAAVAAGVLQQPLRYSTAPHRYIVDVSSAIIPLYVKGGDVTLFRYAMFLLNKCIAQLMFARGIPVTDMRPTLANLKRLLITPSDVSESAKLFGSHKHLDDDCCRTQSLRSLVASERGKQGRQFNRFKHGGDATSPQALSSLRKHSRSVGSYQDDNDLSVFAASSTSIMGSEPNIYNVKMTPPSSNHTPTTKQNSENELSGFGDKVIFTLGDDTDSESKLVRISSNNDDGDTKGLDDNVKIICSEIENYCTSLGDPKDIPIEEHIDIVKYMESRSNSLEENVKMCDACEENDTDLCEDEMCAKNAVEELIVIPSAEAVLSPEYALSDGDRGQN